MRIHHQFGEADDEVFTTVIPLHDAKGIDITLQAGPFEHFFLIVKDPQHRMRALLTWKTRIKQYQIRETFADGSNNTLPGKIMAGEWSFTVVKPGRLCGEIAYDIHCCGEVKENAQPEAVAVLDKPWNDVVNPRSGWYRGDLHAHSEYSDGRVSLQHISRRAIEQHLDFLALTDHSIVTTHFPAGAPLVLPATELTFDNDVHYNVFGLRHFIDYGHYFTHAKNKNEALTALHRDLAASGALIAINHPFSSGMSLAHDFDLRAIHLLEVINAPHLADQPIDNEKAIRFFDFLWLNGHRLTAVGGSDAHKENSGGIYPLGQPITQIYCAGLSIRNLLTGLKGGQTVVDNGVNIQLTLRQALNVILPGSEVSGSVEFDAQGTDPALTWRLMRNGQCINQHTGRHFTFSVNLEPGNYCRLEARLNEQTVFFTNPVYCKLSPPEEYRFSVLRDRFLAADGFEKSEMQ
ncbi:CehA/McbA family metallohydrolase [Enterobacter sp. ENT03]|uniref:CehA/McbA family metallohydrolase n=1 Tax=Enterobacter sp. ENT03 TaxID=2854780 RepID=UPI001C4683A4|nr:CehA/McbA family metallohydrolase [Enterobacter sp. ENT03]MBV7407045.1 CehA/McbA family metallohydrolase [Enterobacter sp. ENT03]